MKICHDSRISPVTHGLVVGVLIADVQATNKPVIASVDSHTVGLLQPASVSPETVTAYPQAQHSVPGIHDSPGRRSLSGLPGMTDDGHSPSRTWSAELSQDNHGSSYSGERQTGLHQQHRHVLKPNDSLDLNLIISSGQMQFARWAYELPWQDSGGLRVGVANSYLSYHLGGSAASLNAYGSAKQHSIWLEQPVWSTQQTQLLWRSQYDDMSMHDLEGTSDSDNDRHAQVLHLGMNLTRLNLNGQGQQWLNLDTGFGYLGFNNATALALDSATADTQGRFVRVNMMAGVQQAVHESLWSLSWQSQWSDHNLDSAQKMSVGGARSVRAYAPGVLSGDNGHLLSAEYKQLLPPAPENVRLSGHWYAGAFIDIAWLTLYRHAYASGANDARLSGSGVFLAWEGPDAWQGKITLSRPFGNTPSQLSGSSYTHDSVWVELTKAFR